MAKILLALIIILCGCWMSSESQIPQSQPISATTENSKLAQVLKVETTGEPNNYTFSVTVSSPDTGCDRYADWWEVISPEGELLYRRVLLHSHVEEQPFQRTGGIVAINPHQTVIVRVHMSSNGYSPMAQQGTVRDGFSPVNLPEHFAAILASVEPLPKNCAF
ncbi:hypothetical protein [Pleurocapsa sp. PCC 7319]|uniref:hypothetical protein n=1 Tax=Pleurocapsa sp. PCC 7319 TaxID=118161 RepID=UPI000369002E|nr:hypothetical protein [Pleurocapsa sp. PCC 7319]